jgi:hypothetical protein
MPQIPRVPHPDGPTAAEFQALLALRLEALSAAAAKTGEMFPREVRERVGWKAHLRVEGRDEDGSLKAHILVSGPRREILYRRQVRLVRKEPLPWELGTEWRGV